ncbi:unnamed protein product [Leuciscus chuanchicus]
MDNASDYGSEDSSFDSWLARSASFASLNGRKLNPLGEEKESSLRGRSHTKSQRACSRREEDPIWSSGQDSWFSPRRPGFDSRYGKLGLSLVHLSRQPARLSVPVALLASGGASATWWVEVLSLTGVPSIAQLVERRTVGGKLAILRSLVRLRLEGGLFHTQTFPWPCSSTLEFVVRHFAITTATGGQKLIPRPGIEPGPGR